MRIVLVHALYLHAAKKRRGFCTSVLFITDVVMEELHLPVTTVQKECQLTLDYEEQKKSIF